MFIVDEVSLLKAMIVSLLLPKPKAQSPNPIGQSSAVHAKAIGAWDVFFDDVNAGLAGS